MTNLFSHGVHTGISTAGARASHPPSEAHEQYKYNRKAANDQKKEDAKAQKLRRNRAKNLVKRAGDAFEAGKNFLGKRAGDAFEAGKNFLGKKAGDHGHDSSSPNNKNKNDKNKNDKNKRGIASYGVYMSTQWEDEMSPNFKGDNYASRFYRANSWEIAQKAYRFWNRCFRRIDI